MRRIRLVSFAALAITIGSPSAQPGYLSSPWVVIGEDVLNGKGSKLDAKESVFTKLLCFPTSIPSSGSQNLTLAGVP
jgi:hypothetical protein